MPRAGGQRACHQRDRAGDRRPCRRGQPVRRRRAGRACPGRGRRRGLQRSERQRRGGDAPAAGQRRSGLTVALIAIAADKGAPGVTTACIALAVVWPRPVLLAECDPAGGDLACWLPAAGGGRLDPGRGLLSLAVAGRRGIGPGQILDHTQKLSGGLDVLAGVVTAEQGAGLDMLWGPAGAALAQLPGLDVIADCGRIGADSPHYDLIASASSVVLVTGTRWRRWCGCGSGSLRSPPRSPAGTGTL